MEACFGFAGCTGDCTHPWGANAWAIVAIWLVGFVIAVTIYDYAKAVISRTRRTGENIPMAFWRLGGKNRRRYGGYIIHLGIVLMAFWDHWNPKCSSSKPRRP